MPVHMLMVLEGGSGKRIEQFMYLKDLSYSTWYLLASSLGMEMEGILLQVGSPDLTAA